MSRRLSFLIQQACAAPRVVTYGVLEDVDQWSSWMPGVRTAGWERPGQTSPTDVGAIRTMTAAGLTAREQITAADPPNRQAYTMLSGLPVKDYQAEVKIDDDGGGCLITWSATFAPRVRGTGHLIRQVMRSSIARTAAALAREAERAHDSAG